MNPIINSVINTLQKSKILLDELSDEQLSNKSVPPYHSSIGSHVRHILDFLDCILNMKNGIVDLTQRKRDESIETSSELAINYLESVIKRLNDIAVNLEKEIIVIDDLGMGKIEIKYNLSALLAQANSHTIHHYAIINYILRGLGIAFDDYNFGYNPTTPRYFTS